jgi:DNA-binding response OmpR family regulator
VATKKILVVDDEPDVVTLIARTLVSEGFDVVTAYDGIAALDIAETESPDIVLLDIMMPMMSGYEVCQQLKSNPQTQSIPVIFLTSAHTPDARNKSREAGGDTLIMKPFSAAELVAQIRRSLGEPPAE